MRTEVKLIAESFFRTNTMPLDRAIALAELAVTIYEKEQHRGRMRIVEQNPATRIQQQCWR